MSAARIPVVGIIGGIGSGKTAVAEELSRFLKSRRLDADAAGHLALRQPEIQQRLRDSFGNEVVNEQGEVIRPLLARQVFGSTEEHRRARKKLEEIVHPFIRCRLEQELAALRHEQLCDVILIDAALLLEAGWDQLCDAVVFIDVPEAERQRRTRSRGWTDEEFRRREASQLELEQKKLRADQIIDNSADLVSAARNLADWIQHRFSPEFPERSDLTNSG